MLIWGYSILESVSQLLVLASWPCIRLEDVCSSRWNLHIICFSPTVLHALLSLYFLIMLAICIRFSDFLPIEFLSDTELAFMMKISKIHIPLSIFVLLTKNDSLLSAVIGLMVGHSSPFITNIEEVKANWIFLDMNIKIWSLRFIYTL